MEPAMNRRALLFAPLALPLLASCRSVDAQQTTTLVGVVETVDQTSREVLLRGQAGAQSGALVTVIAGRGVQRLAQIKPGDRVTVVYYQALAASAVRPRAGSNPPAAGMMVLRNAERPGGEVTRVISGRITVTAVSGDTINFVGPGNLPRTVTVRNADVQRFIRTLNPGDQVDLVYEEALAISIEPMK
jgi:hypothetical protein